MAVDTAESVQNYLHKHIPLSRAMGVVVRRADAAGVVLTAPLAPNINHRETVFGGSASSLAILAAWAMVHFGLQREGLSCRVVIRRNSMTYEMPVPGDFSARCDAPDAATWSRFLVTLRRKRMAGIAVTALLEYGNAIAGRMDGLFVAVRNPHAS